jgi:hypothetical protein
MTGWRILCSLAFGFWLIVALASTNREASAAQFPRQPSEAEFDRLLGEKLSHPIKSIKWQAGEPPQTNLFIYAAQAVKFQADKFKALADSLGIKGDAQPLSASMFYAPGYWVKEPNPTNKESWKALIFSEVSGLIRYNNGEDNHKWDIKNHKPLAEGVPTEAEALQRTLALLPAFGISTNDLEYLPNGKLRYSCNDEGTKYSDRFDGGKQKRYIRQINIELWQKIRDGASIVSLGGGGMLTVGFMSEGKLAEVQLVFRHVSPIGKASPVSANQMIAFLRNGECRTFRQNVPTELTITNCTLVYPQADASVKQDILWPAYALDAISVEDSEPKVIRIYQPLKP